MKTNPEVFEQFVKWVQRDMEDARVLVNRKVFSVVLWCLIFPAVVLILIYGLRRFGIIQSFRFLDLVIFMPPFLFAVISLWPTLRDLPHVFKIGGIGSLLEESLRECRWREETTARLLRDFSFTSQEWRMIDFHLECDLARMRAQNRYMTLLTGVVFFFMYQFLDLGGGAGEEIFSAGTAGVVRGWVEQLSQWGTQVVTVLLFSMLFFLSGMQLQKHLERYAGCVKRIQLRGEPG